MSRWRRQWCAFLPPGAALLVTGALGGISAAPATTPPASAAPPRAVAEHPNQKPPSVRHRGLPAALLAAPPGLVPAEGLSSHGLVSAYGATPLRAAGYDGKGQTVVVFAWNPPRPQDLARFDAEQGLAPPRLVLSGEGPGKPFADARSGLAAVTEADLDVEVVHAIAPGARIVVYDAGPSRPALEISGAATSPASITRLFDDAGRQYPGAIWNLSIGWLCDRFYSWPSLEAVNAALLRAEQTGTSAFMASGDEDGLECSPEVDFSYDTPPSPLDTGLDAISELPAMTAVGGTALSVTPNGEWFAEEAWAEPADVLGSAGGVALDVPRPAWQSGPGVGAGLSAAEQTRREVPDVSADADWRTGAKLVLPSLGSPGHPPADEPGSGTSQAAPIWSALCALIDQYLEQNGGHALGEINPLLYELARTRQPHPPFHDVTLGENARYVASVGYDPVTGLGTPIADNLARDLLHLERPRS